MRLVHDQSAAGSARDFGQVIHGGPVAVHTEEGLGDQETPAVVGCLVPKGCAGSLDVQMGVNANGGAGEAAAIDQAGVVGGVRNDEVAAIGQGGDQTEVGLIAGGEEQGRGETQEGSDEEFQGTMLGEAVTLGRALVFAHDTGDGLLQVDDAGTTITTWSIGRVPSGSFLDVVLDGVGGDGQHLIVTVSDALGDGNLEMEFSDSVVAGSHVIMTGYYDGANPTLCPVQIEVG